MATLGLFDLGSLLCYKIRRGLGNKQETGGEKSHSQENYQNVYLIQNRFLAMDMITQKRVGKLIGFFLLSH